MRSIKPIFKESVWIDLIKNPIRVFFDGSCKKDQLKMIFKLSHELVNARSHKIVVLSFIVMDEGFIQIDNKTILWLVFLERREKRGLRGFDHLSVLAKLFVDFSKFFAVF